MESLIKVRKEALPYRGAGLQILSEMHKNGAPFPVASLAERIRKPYATTYGAVRKLEDKGRLRIVRKGVYELTEKGTEEAVNFRGQVKPIEEPTVVTWVPVPETGPEHENELHYDPKDPDSFRISMCGADGYEKFRETAKALFGIADRKRNAVPEPTDWQREFVQIAHELARGGRNG